MDTQDTEAYLNLVDQLLQCSIGEEQQILNDNQELIDSVFVQQMLEEANELIEKGDLSNANRLMNVAGYLLGAYDDAEATTSTKLNFLRQVLQAISDSNVDQNVIYPLLQANLDKLDDGFATVLRSWATARLKEVESQQAQIIAKLIGEFSNLIAQFPSGNRASNQEIAVAGYKVVLSIFVYERFPYLWAVAQNNLGSAYNDRIRGEQADNLEKAINCFQSALQVYRTHLGFIWEELKSK